MVDRERLVRAFLDLVRIDSPSGEEEALAAEAARRLEALGGETGRDAFGNLIARFAGEGEPLLLGTHLDTVEPGRGVKPLLEGGVIRTDGSTVLGGDPKSGLAAILEGLAVVRERGMSHAPIEVVLTRHEESGLEGARNLDYSLLTARRGVEFDGEGAVSNVTIAAPARVRVEVEFVGRAAHAGVEPEKGISAIHMAARFVAGYPQGRLDEETTANIGLITGGSAANAVSEHASLKAEFRSRGPRSMEEVRQAVEDLAASVRREFPEGKVLLRMEQEFGGYKLPQDHEMVRRVTAAITSIGLEPRLIASGGATDANVFALHGIEAVVVGLGGEGFHTVRESLRVERLVQAAEFCVALISGASKPP
jgi:tripeptide aminopeptidase